MSADLSPAEPSASDPPRRPLRWVVAPLLVALLTSAAVAWIRSRPEFDADYRNVFTYIALLAGGLLLLAWFLFLAPFRRAVRLQTLFVLFAIPLVAAALFRIEGFTGDMWPRVVSRWAPPPDRLLPAAGATSAAATPDDLSLGQPLHDYPQFLGPDRSAAVRGVRLDRDWKARPPRELWRRPLGAAWSGFAIAGTRAVTQEQRGDEELVTCYDLTSGEPLWAHADPGRHSTRMGGIGPRATPTIVGERVYALGPEGRLNCLDLATGEVIWSRDVVKENSAPPISWGRACSPLVVGGKVIVSAGGPGGRSLVAYDAENGEPLWSGGSDRASYASPVFATLEGIPQVLTVNEDFLVAHALDDGRELWRQPWPGNSDSNATTSQPVPLPGGQVFLSKGYGIGCQLLDVVADDDGGLGPQLVWEQPALMRTKMTNVVVHDGHVYGLSGGILECVDLAKGERRWKGGRYGHGQVLLVDDLLLVTAENGDLVLVEVTPDERRELARAPVFAEKTWNNPAFAPPYLLHRNDREAACLLLPLEE